MIGATPPSSICRGARRRLCGFAPHTRKSLISPLRGANFLQGRGAVAAGVCASLPGKAYSSVERRKPFAGKSPRRQCEFAPPSLESLISPSRDANLSPGKAPGGCESLRSIPRKALFFRRETQTFHPEEQPAAVRVCAPLPGKPYSSVERRKPFAGESARKSPGGCESLRLAPGKALFFR